MGQDEAKMGQDGPTLEAILLMLRENCLFQQLAFRLGGSAILGLRRAQRRPRWSYVGTQVASLGAGSELRWPMLALGRCMLALLGSVSGSEGYSPTVSGPPRVPRTSGHEGGGGLQKVAPEPLGRLYVDI